MLKDVRLCVCTITLDSVAGRGIEASVHRKLQMNLTSLIYFSDTQLNCGKLQQTK